MLQREDQLLLMDELEYITSHKHVTEDQLLLMDELEYITSHKHVTERESLMLIVVSTGSTVTVGRAGIYNQS